MAFFVSLTVVKNENSSGTIQLAIPTIGAGGIVFEQIPTSFNTGGITAISKVIFPALGLNQKRKEYYSPLTVAALTTLMGSSSFSPSDLSNLWGWYDAGTNVTGTTSVTSWGDKSGNGRNLISVAGSEPRLLTNAYNGLPIITPKVGSTAMMSTVSNFPIGEFTVFIVGSQTTAAAPLTDNNGFFLYSGSNSMVIRRASNLNQIAGTGSGLSINSVNDTFYSIRVQYQPAGPNRYRFTLNNGTEVYENSTGLTTPDIISLFDDGYSAPGNKRIAETILYNRALSAGEITQVENYLKTKYNHY